MDNLKNDLKTYIRTLLLAILGTWIVSCEETSLIGDDLLDTDSFDVSYIDSLTLNFYTSRLDSIYTSTNSQLLVGDYNDSIIGEVISKAYFIVDPSETTMPDLSDGDFRYDSATLILAYNGYSFYDSDERVGLKVSQLVEDLEYGDDGALYNTTTKYDDPNNLEIGYTTFKQDIEEGEEIEIGLDDELGFELFTDIQNEEEASTSYLEFQQKYHGFQLSATSDQSPFYGFYSDSIVLRVYYTDLNKVPVQQSYVNFTTGSSRPYFSQISNSNAVLNTELEELEDKLPSSDLDMTSLVTGGTGYCTRLEIPYVRSILLEDEDYIISYADLQIKPTISSIDYSNTPLPSILQASLVDNANNALLDTPFYLSLVEDLEFGRDSYYHMDASDLIDFLLTPYVNTNDYALLISVEDSEIGSSVNRVPLGDGDYGSKLILYTIKTK
ncbi:MAG: DUF4270 family protein [Cyclobacteriaceae bacterium]